MTDYKKITEDGLEVLHLIEKDPKISQEDYQLFQFSLEKLFRLKAR